MQKGEISKRMSFFTGPLSSKTSIFSIVKKDFKHEGKHHYLTSRQLGNITNHVFWDKICKRVKLAKNFFFRRFALTENFNRFYFLIGLENKEKHHLLTSVQLRNEKKKISIWSQNMQKGKTSKNCHFSRSAVIEDYIYYYCWTAIENGGKFHYLTSGQPRNIKILFIWTKIWKRVKSAKNFIFCSFAVFINFSLYVIFYVLFYLFITNNILNREKIFFSWLRNLHLKYFW